MDTLHNKYECALAYDKLSRFPELHAETIALHYLSNAAFARNLYALVKAKQHGHRSDEADKAIAYLTQRMKDEHALVFGLPLEWTKRGELKSKFTELPLRPFSAQP